jgi:hypothetical protein
MSGEGLDREWVRKALEEKLSGRGERWLHGGFLALAACAVLGALVLGWRTYVELSRRKPFLMHVGSAEGQGYVQFEQPDRGWISPKFPMDGHPEGAWSVELRSGEAEIPGGEIEFSDTSLLPGHFRIRLGTRRFDVMEARLEVDGRPHRWEPAGRANE